MSEVREPIASEADFLGQKMRKESERKE